MSQGISVVFRLFLHLRLLISSLLFQILVLRVLYQLFYVVFLRFLILVGLGPLVFNFDFLGLLSPNSHKVFQPYKVVIILEFVIDYVRFDTMLELNAYLLVHSYLAFLELLKLFQKYDFFVFVLFNVEEWILEDCLLQLGLFVYILKMLPLISFVFYILQPTLYLVHYFNISHS